MDTQDLMIHCVKDKGRIYECDTLRAELAAITKELDRINRVAATQTTKNWLALSDENKCQWFAQTLHIDSQRCEIIRNQEQQIAELRDALIHHIELTRPIHRSIEALARTAPKDESLPSQPVVPDIGQAFAGNICPHCQSFVSEPHKPYCNRGRATAKMAFDAVCHARTEGGSMNEEILKLAKECGATVDNKTLLMWHHEAIAFYRAAYNKAIEDAAKECDALEKSGYIYETYDGFDEVPAEACHCAAAIRALGQS